MINFMINGDAWVLRYVEPSNPYLIDRTGKYTLGCTDPTSRIVYISKYLSKALTEKVITHELCHCVMVSYGYTDYVKDIVYPWQLIDVEELICNIITDHTHSFSTILDYILRKSGLR